MTIIAKDTLMITPMIFPGKISMVIFQRGLLRVAPR